MRTEVKVDSRGHIPLSWRKHKHTWYLCDEDEDGRIILTPANLVPAIVRNEPSAGHGVMEAIREFGFPERKVTE